jgi:uncharacterized protein (DUF1810 family)
VDFGSQWGRNMSDSTGSLDRFINAQNESYDEIIRELKNGEKVTHWMWYVFPQIAGLGQSAIAKFYAIQDASEAQAYLDHPILGKRLLECTKIVLAIKGKSALEIFGNVDAMKLRSSMTLFMSVAGSDFVFQEAIDKYFDEEPDEKTLDILSGL